jgi:hypothetical protein
MVSRRETLRDPNLFAPFFSGPSWRRWHTFWSALYAEPPRGDDLTIFQTYTGRTTWPSAPFREATLIIDRRGGKSRALALIATYLASFRDYTPWLAPGQKARVAVLAKDRDQAGEIFDHVTGMLDETPLLASMILRRDSETLELQPCDDRHRHCELSRRARLHPRRGVVRRGGFLAYPDVEILRAVRPGLANIPGSMLLVASSPYARRGELITPIDDTTAGTTPRCWSGRPIRRR